VAGEILADRLLGRRNPWATVFDSNRLKPRASARRFVRENLRSGARLLRERLAPTETSLPELSRGQGTVLELGGERVAAYKDDEGKVKAVSAVCPHAGCLVGWNAPDRTWDCPCHGSRFDSTDRCASSNETVQARPIPFPHLVAPEWARHQQTREPSAPDRVAELNHAVLERARAGQPHRAVREPVAT